jgi:hypothetical protein
MIKTLRIRDYDKIKKATNLKKLFELFKLGILKASKHRYVIKITLKSRLKPQLNYYFKAFLFKFFQKCLK